jgi:hypothetical protein
VALDRLTGGSDAAMSNPERWLREAGRILAVELGMQAP